MRLTLALLAPILCTAACVAAPHKSNDELARQVAETERAFAATMAHRDHAAFKHFLSKETVFYGAKGPLRGSEAVAEAWQKFYEKPEAPFSWAPQDVVVLDSGTLALSSGPVYGPDGKRIGTFTSTWRLEAPETWRIVFDKGCDCGP